MTPKQAGELWGISERRVQVLCVNDQVEGAERLGGKVWLIPKGAPKPEDGRTKAAKQKVLKKDEGKKQAFLTHKKLLFQNVPNRPI